MQQNKVLICFNNFQEKRFAEHDKITNRKLLWHGTNVAVVAAILKSGLRIMPHSGGRVGSGIYFASENSKSAGYGALLPYNSPFEGVLISKFLSEGWIFSFYWNWVVRRNLKEDHRLYLQAFSLFNLLFKKTLRTLPFSAMRWINWHNVPEWSCVRKGASYYTRRLEIKSSAKRLRLYYC